MSESIRKTMTETYYEVWEESESGMRKRTRWGSHDEAEDVFMAMVDGKVEVIGTPRLVKIEVMTLTTEDVTTIAQQVPVVGAGS